MYLPPKRYDATFHRMCRPNSKLTGYRSGSDHLQIDDTEIVDPRLKQACDKTGISGGFRRSSCGQFG